MDHRLSRFAVVALILAFLTLGACNVMLTTPSTFGEEMLLSFSTETSARATLIAALMTQEENNADNQAIATARIVRGNAQATLSSANATLSAAQTQDQNLANIIAAQIAATAAVARANAQATLNSAGSTQSAALTQDAIRQTQAQYDLQVTEAAGTHRAEAMLTQQNINNLAAGTQTAAANLIATQSRQREEQTRAPVAFLWMWCLPIFVVLFAGLCLWGFWRWLKIQRANQRILENPVDRLQAPAVEIIHHQQDDSLPYLEGDIVDSHNEMIKPDDQIRRWLDEVKRKLLNSEEKDKYDNPDS